MTRWELLQAFYSLARLLFIESNRITNEELLIRVKAHVMDVITESGSKESAPRFGVDENDK